MKRNSLRSLLLAAAFVLLCTGNAYALKDELCLQVTSTNTGIVHFVTLSVVDLRIGHVLLHGDGCYEIPLGDGASANDCVPMHGNGIMHEGKLEIGLQSLENQVDFGHAIFTASQIHVWIDDLTALTGSWAGESLTSIEGGAQDVQQFDKGTVLGVPCAKVTAETKRADRQFRAAIKKLDAQK